MRTRIERTLEAWLRGRISNNRTTGWRRCAGDGRGVLVPFSPLLMSMNDTWISDIFGNGFLRRASPSPECAPPGGNQAGPQGLGTAILTRPEGWLERLSACIGSIWTVGGGAGGGRGRDGTGAIESCKSGHALTVSAYSYMTLMPSNMLLFTASEAMPCSRWVSTPTASCDSPSSSALALGERRDESC